MTATDDSYSLPQLRELRRLALALGFMDDVAHWDRQIAKLRREDERR
jgi:hypothetical protein